MPVTLEPEVRAAPESKLSLKDSLGRLSVRPRSVALLLALPSVSLLAGVLGWLFDWRLGVDSAVYRAGAITLLHGEPLYNANTLGPEPWWALCRSPTRRPPRCCSCRSRCCRCRSRGAWSPRCRFSRWHW